MRYDFTVEGMDCASCESRLKRALERAEGVRLAEADHRSRSVVVEADEEKVAREAVRGLIERAGFDVVGP